MALTAGKLQQAEYARLRFAITPEPYESLADVLKTEYWVHVAGMLRPQSIIEVVPQDGSYYAELFVHSCDKTFATVRLLRVVVLDEEQMVSAQKAAKEAMATSGKKGEKPIPEADKGTEHYVDWAGPQHKGRVIRTADKQVIKEGFATKKEAYIWMLQHEETLAKNKKANDEKLLGEV